MTNWLSLEHPIGKVDHCDRYDLTIIIASDEVVRLSIGFTYGEPSSCANFRDRFQLDLIPKRWFRNQKASDNIVGVLPPIDFDFDFDFDFEFEFEFELI